MSAAAIYFLPFGGIERIFGYMGLALLVYVHGRAVGLRHEPTADLAPVGVELQRGRDVHEQRKSHVPEDALDAPEGQEVDRGGDRDQRDQ
jgi:hypothetical protein